MHFSETGFFSKESLTEADSVLNKVTESPMKKNVNSIMTTKNISRSSISLKRV